MSILLAGHCLAIPSRLIGPRTSWSPHAPTPHALSRSLTLRDASPSEDVLPPFLQELLIKLECTLMACLFNPEASLHI